jgi:DNA invertase Pin-like site-specific DNA recombinase
MKAAIYARVSRTDDTQHPENQVHDLTAWAGRLGYDLVKVYVDKQSGAKDDRPGLKDALRAAHRREYDVLLVAALDRVSRGGVLATMGILERLARSGVGLKSLREEHLDTANPLMRELLVALYAVFAKMERANFADRIRSGMARARREGKHVGRPRVEIDVDQAQRAVAKCGSLRTAAAYLGVSLGTLQRRLAAVATSATAAGVAS